MALLLAVKVRTLQYLFTQKEFVNPKPNVLTLGAKYIYIKTFFCSLLLLILQFS